MSTTDVLWVGVSLDPDDNRRIPRSRISAAHDAIVQRICEPDLRNAGVVIEFTNGSTVTEYNLGAEAGVLVDIYDALGCRIGFGIKTADSEHGKSLIPKVTDLLNRMGISLPVSVWAWSPASVPSYTVKRQ